MLDYNLAVFTLVRANGREELIPKSLFRIFLDLIWWLIFAALSIFYDGEAAQQTSQTSTGEHHVNSAILALLQQKQGQHFDQLIQQLAKSVGHL